jgi:hypothetical protein
MKEIVTCEIWTGLKIKVVIERETGEFVLFNCRFRLDIQDKKAFLKVYRSEKPLLTGYLCQNRWCFEENDCRREGQDPYIAAIQMLYDIFQYC